MCLPFFYKQINDLKPDYCNDIFKNNAQTEVINNINILIIDDQEFDYLDTLKHTFPNIQQMKSIANLAVVQGFQIVLCDINGVWNGKDPVLQGAALIEEIKANYPMKFVVAYTAASYDPNVHKHLKKADDYIGKSDLNVSQWRSKLIEYSVNLANPKFQWERISRRLQDAKVPTIDIARLESNYVKAINSGKTASIEKLAKKSSSSTKYVKESLEFIMKILPPILTIIANQAGKG